jgi:peptidoglycan/LPS O-acetylase OafA/YrhL
MNIPNVPRLSERASTHLDLIRGMAALAVLTNHLRNLFFVNYPQLAHKNAALTALYAFAALGHQCVMVFFVLSGFFVSASVLKYRTPEAWSARGYAINRLARLYVVFLPALVFTALSDFIARQLPFGDLYFNHPVPDFGQVIFAAQDNLKQFFGNLFFLQTITVRSFGSNGALWSLSNEFWYYVIWPLVFLAIAAGPRTRRLIAAAAAVLLLALLPASKSASFLIWLLGVAVVLAAPYLARLSAWFRSRVTSIVLAGVFLIAALVGRRFYAGFNFASDLLVGGSFTFPLLAIVYSPRTKHPGKLYARTAHGLASFSYSLYAIHFPTLVFLRTALGKYSLWQPDALHLLYGFLLLVLVVAIAWAFPRVTEAHTDSVREFSNRVVDAVLERWKPKTRDTAGAFAPQEILEQTTNPAASSEITPTRASLAAVAGADTTATD